MKSILIDTPPCFRTRITRQGIVLYDQIGPGECAIPFDKPNDYVGYYGIEIFDVDRETGEYAKSITSHHNPMFDHFFYCGEKPLSLNWSQFISPALQVELEVGTFGFKDEK